jgi:hypothetical protein
VAKRKRARDYRADLFKYEDAEGKQRVGRHTPICDFCSGDPEEFPIRWSYPVGPMPVNLGGVITRSDDDWAACAECHALIEQLPKSRSQLIARIVTVQMDTYAPGATMKRSDMAELIARLALHLVRFENARLGPAESESNFEPPPEMRPDEG